MPIRAPNMVAMKANLVKVLIPRLVALQAYSEISLKELSFIIPN